MTRPLLTALTAWAAVLAFPVGSMGGVAITNGTPAEALLVEPHSGLPGEPVTIYGTGFSEATAVHFGETSASFTVIEPGNEIVATVPAIERLDHSVEVDVSVTTPGGVSRALPSTRFAWLPTIEERKVISSESVSVTNTASGPFADNSGAGLSAAGPVSTPKLRDLYCTCKGLGHKRHRHHHRRHRKERRR